MSGDGPSSPSGAFDPTKPDGGSSSTTTTPCVPNASAFDVPGNGCDDDGNGKVDDIVSCDQSLDVDGDAEQLAKAMGLCEKASATTWGLVSARYTNGFTRSTSPADGQHGILPRFGTAVTAREGGALGVLSTGYAREYDSASPSQKLPFNQQPPKAIQESPSPDFPSVTVATHGEPPPGWPKAAAGCPALQNDTFDMASVELVVKVPSNAKGIRFDFDFYSGEWPQWVCSSFNDGFVAMLRSQANKTGEWENISFDAKGNPVSVNFAFFDRCSPGVKTSCKQSAPVTSVCAGGPGELAGTGFAIVDDYCGYGTTSTGGGATGWLVSEAPVVPGETITLKLMVWDTGDFKYDSSVLVDHLHWVPIPVKETTTQRAPPVVR
jgi:hypothetical protein